MRWIKSIDYFIINHKRMQKEINSQSDGGYDPEKYKKLDYEGWTKVTNLAQLRKGMQIRYLVSNKYIYEDGKEKINKEKLVVKFRTGGFITEVGDGYIVFASHVVKNGKKLSFSLQWKNVVEMYSRMNKSKGGRKLGSKNKPKGEEKKEEKIEPPAKIRPPSPKPVTTLKESLESKPRRDFFPKFNKKKY